MHITEMSYEGVFVLDLGGRLDAAIAPTLADRLTASQRPAPRDVLLDLEHVTYIASASVRVLVTHVRTIRSAGRRMVLTDVPELVFEVFEINGLNQEFLFAMTRDEGLELLLSPDEPFGTGF